MRPASVDSNECIETKRTPMATLTIRNLDERTKAQLRLQAARHGRSMEEEVRAILRQAVAGAPPPPATEGVGRRIHAHFARLGGLELDLPVRSDQPDAPDFSELAR
jgi:antitoxin FitA